MPALVRAAAGIAGVILCAACILATNPLAAAVFGLAGACLILAAIGRSPDTEGN